MWLRWVETAQLASSSQSARRSYGTQAVVEEHAPIDHAELGGEIARLAVGPVEAARRIPP